MIRHFIGGGLFSLNLQPLRHAVIISKKSRQNLSTINSNDNAFDLKRMQGLPKKVAIDGVSKILLVASGKGGVGKSTVAVNLAISISKLGLRTGLLDADLFGPSIPRMMNLSPPHNGIALDENKRLIPMTNYGVKCMSMGLLISESSPIVWRGLMVMKGIEQLLRQVAWSSLDLLVIDLPPGTGDVQLSISQLVPIDGALLITTPQDVAIADVKRAVEMFNKVKVPSIGVVKNKSCFTCPHCGVNSDIYPQGKNISDLGVNVISNIPIEPNIALGCDIGIPTTISHPESKTSIEFSNLAKLVINKLCL